MYPGVPIGCCFSHLGQSLYHRIQEEGLQVPYNDPGDRTSKEYTHSTLTFVPLDTLKVRLTSYEPRVPLSWSRFWSILSTHTFGASPLQGKNGDEERGCRCLRNMSQIYGISTTSPGTSPDLYSRITEFLKEQAYTELCIAELSLGQRIKAMSQKAMGFFTKPNSRCYCRI